MKLVAAALTLFSLSTMLGCTLSSEQPQGGPQTAPPAPQAFECPRGTPYRVLVSPALAGPWGDAAVAAFASWKGVMGSSFDYTIETSAQASWSLNGCEIAIVDGSVGAEYWGEAVVKNGPDGRLAGAVIQLHSTAPEGTPDVAIATALHEVGHVLGLEHDSDLAHCTAMRPFITIPGVVGCADAAIVCERWGCVVPVACTEPSVCL